MTANLWPWIIFTAFVLGMLALDLGVFHRHAHVVSKREAALWSLVWVLLALTFNAGLYYHSGPERALEFLTGYLIEKSLSVDNIFVFLLIFSYFAVPPAYQHRILFWGILGALVMHGIFIAVGAALLQHFHWVIYVFGAFLVFTGIKMLLKEETDVHPEANPVIRLLRRLMPLWERDEGPHFFVKRHGQWFATPLLVVLLTVESTDLIFAVDSIPAIFAVTADPFIVYTSNVFAILGLRALYFLVAGVLDVFCYLRYGLGLVLAFVGLKMILADIYKIPIGVSLGVVAGILALSIVVSLLFPRKQSKAEDGVTPSFLHRWKVRAQQQLLRWPGTLGIGVTTAAVGVAIVSVVSLYGGPSVQHAVLIVHRAQQDIAEARQASPRVAPSALQEAETELSLAQTALAERRYDTAIAAAIRAKEIVRELSDHPMP
jgi:tellurite resistance protein TerC